METGVELMVDDLGSLRTVLESFSEGAMGGISLFEVLLSSYGDGLEWGLAESTSVEELESVQRALESGEEIPFEMEFSCSDVASIENVETAFAVGAVAALSHRSSSKPPSIVWGSVWRGMTIGEDFLSEYSAASEVVWSQVLEVESEFKSQGVKVSPVEEGDTGDEITGLPFMWLYGDYLIGSLESLRGGFYRLTYSPSSVLSVRVSGSFDSDFLEAAKELATVLSKGYHSMGSWMFSDEFSIESWLVEVSYLIGSATGSQYVREVVEDRYGGSAVYRPVVYRRSASTLSSRVGVLLKKVTEDEQRVASGIVFDSLNSFKESLLSKESRCGYHGEGMLAGFEQAASIVYYRMKLGVSPAEVYLDLLGLAPAVAKPFSTEESRSGGAIDLGVGAGWRGVIDRVRNVIVAMER